MASSYYFDFERSQVANASLHPPIHGEGPDAAAGASVLLDFRAYFDGRTNATTAYSKTRDGHTISVTFWPHRPPRVSCFSVHCPDLNPGDFAEEPLIIATQDDLVLLGVSLGTWPWRNIFDYFIYQAAGGAGSGRPSLELLKHPGPSREFPCSDLGLLRCTTPKRDDSLPTLRSHSSSKDDSFYIVAVLSNTSMVPGHYNLYTYDSRTKDWATRTALLRHEQELGHYSSHRSSKVIMVGGEAGTMGWVDLTNGSILFCDVLLQGQTVPLCHIALPDPLIPNEELPRDIAVVNGRIRYVEMRRHIRPGSVSNGDFIADDWTAATWSWSRRSLEKGSWQPSCKVSASQISTKKKSAQFELLPKLLDDQGIPQPTLERLHTEHPMLSLHQDNLVYFMTKIHYQKGNKAWVLAVDTKKKTLEGVAEVGVQRTLGMDFSYMCSSISQHLHMASAPPCHLKRPPMVMWQSSLKKHARTTQMDSLAWGGEQKDLDSDVEGTSARALNHDDMDLE